jgi:DNA-binding NarL/FixJ family response regulator
VGDSQLHSHQRRRLGNELGIEPTAFARPSVLVAQAASETRRRFVSVLREAFPKGSVMTSDRVRESLDILGTHPIAMAVIDPDLLDGSGIHLVQRCVRSRLLTRCVITTPSDDDACLVQALAAGALGCLVENQPEAVLVQQLRLLADGIPPLAPSIAGRLLSYFRSEPTPGRASIHLDAHCERGHLSQNEEQVLSLIAAGVQISEVARLLDVSTNIVCGYVKSIYLKRNPASRGEAALESQYLGVA